MRSEFFRVWCRFEADHINPLTGRCGQWRVVHLVECWRPDLPVLNQSDVQLLGIISTKPYPRGSIIRPHRELSRVLAVMREPVVTPLVCESRPYSYTEAA